jgi:hypothetical protein
VAIDRAEDRLWPMLADEARAVLKAGAPRHRCGGRRPVSRSRPESAAYVFESFCCPRSVRRSSAVHAQAAAPRGAYTRSERHCNSSERSRARCPHVRAMGSTLAAKASAAPGGKQAKMRSRERLWQICNAHEESSLCPARLPMFHIVIVALAEHSQP